LHIIALNLDSNTSLEEFLVIILNEKWIHWRTQEYSTHRFNCGRNNHTVEECREKIKKSVTCLI
jgi:hypothetical protein